MNYDLTYASERNTGMLLTLPSLPAPLALPYQMASAGDVPNTAADVFRWRRGLFFMFWVAEIIAFGRQSVRRSIFILTIDLLSDFELLNVL